MEAVPKFQPLLLFYLATESGGGGSLALVLVAHLLFDDICQDTLDTLELFRFSKEFTGFLKSSHSVPFISLVPSFWLGLLSRELYL